jgi:hypothetical protein
VVRRAQVYRERDDQAGRVLLVQEGVDLTAKGQGRAVVTGGGPVGGDRAGARDERAHVGQGAGRSLCVLVFGTVAAEQPRPKTGRQCLRSRRERGEIGR